MIRMLSLGFKVVLSGWQGGLEYGERYIFRLKI